MAHFSQHNRMRLAAGLSIDPKHEISEANKHKATVVVADPRSAIEIVLDDSIFDVLNESKGACQKCQALQQEDPDFQAAWKLKTQAAQLQRSKPDMARGQMAAAAMHMEKFEARKSALKCDDCKNGVVTKDVPADENEELAELPSSARRVSESAEQVNEFVVGKQKFDSWEDDDKQPVNVVSKDDTVADKPDDADEAPDQVGDTPSQQDQSGGGDHDRKVAVPAKIKQLIRAEIKEAEGKAKNVDYANRVAGYQYDDLASMFKDLLQHLDGGTVYDIKQAQIFMTGLMGPMLHKIPADVVNFIARGGNKPASLKSYMTKVNMTQQNPNKLS